MRRRCAVAGLVLAVSCLAPAGPVAGAGVTREQLDEIVKKLEAGAKEWLRGADVAKPVEGSLKGVSFDEGSVAHLNNVLRSFRRDMARLYAINRLLDRLAAAKPQAIRGALANVKTLHNRVRSFYRQVPQLSRAQAEALVLPDSCRGMNTEAIMGRMSLLESLRDQKVEREQAAVRHNSVIGDVESNAYRLMYLADDPQEDVDLVKAVFLEERRGSFTFITLLDELTRGAQKMSPERARRLCPLFRPHLARLAMQNRKPYVNQGKINVSRSGTSDYEKKDEYAGIRVLTAYNQLVRAAKSKQLKPVKVPTTKDIDEYHKKRRS